MISKQSPYQYTFTVFTTTYNRAHTLHRVYESLKAQTFREFEWLIVDDGSTDNTRDLVKAWQREAEFPIRYLWQENRGKHVAFNRAVQEAMGKFFLTFDSDDACVPQALERLKFYWDSIPEKERPQFSAVTALCVDQHGKLIGDKFPQDITDSDSLEIRYRYKVKGEKWGFHRTEVLRTFPFPEIEGCKFIPEGLTWSAIARRFRTRFVNEPLRVYFRSENEPSEQLTGSGDPAKHALGHALWHQSILNHDINWFRHAPEQFLRSALHYVRFSFHTRTGVFDQVKKLENIWAKVLWGIMLPLGFFVYVRDRKWISN